MRHSSTTSRCQDGLHEGDPLRLCKTRMRRRQVDDRWFRMGFALVGFLQHLIHGFPLSGPESGHTERRCPRAKARLSRPFSFIRTLTVGFGIAPNLLTLLPLSSSGRKALAGLGLSTLTAGGDFHPALRTSAARYETAWPELCRTRRRPGKHALAWRQSACAHAPQRIPARSRTRRSNPTRSRHEFGSRVNDRRPRQSDSGLFSKLIIVTAISCGRARFACGRTRRAVARIPQITSLDPGRPPGDPIGIAAGSGSVRCHALRASHACVSTQSKDKVETACPSSKASSIPGTIRSRWSRTSPPITTGRSNVPAKTRSRSSPRATGPTTSFPSPG